jgi:protein-L-isoaspartate(D-aspartate) O-methyltransferase
MTLKDRRFPLQLSSVVNNATKADGNGFKQIATPQTAMKNAAQKAPQNSWASIPAREPIVKGISTYLSKRPDLDNALATLSIRRAMVSRVGRQGVKDTLALSALEAIPRHLFIESGFSAQAYADASLPIGHQQTISQPYIVARMIEIMRNGRDLGCVLEIGTGCGYQAAVLSLVAKEIYSIERIKALHDLAKNNLRPLRISNIRLHYGDGMLGLPQVAPFDGIILAAAGLQVPQELLEQLAIGGRLIAPVGGENQVLQLIERVNISEWRHSVLEQCHFVPLRQGVI